MTHLIRFSRIINCQKRIYFWLLKTKAVKIYDQSKYFICFTVKPLFKISFQSDPILQDISIAGEISNFKLHKPSGHMYFTLKDEESIIRCVFFRSKNKNAAFLPGEGMKVIASGNVSLYERSGYYQLYIDRLEPEGLGTLYLAFEQLKEKLRKQGLFDAQYKKPLPYIPQKLA